MDIEHVVASPLLGPSFAIPTIDVPHCVVTVAAGRRAGSASALEAHPPADGSVLDVARDRVWIIGCRLRLPEIARRAPD